jgi:hypothetical protein
MTRAPVADSMAAMIRFFESLRAVYDGPVGFHESVSGRLGIAAHRDLHSLKIEPLSDFHDIAPGWVSTHGNFDDVQSSIAGNTALNLAKRIGKSVVMGHTRRMGIGSYTTGFGDDKKNEPTLTGMEVGNLVDTKRAGYPRDVTNGWQLGFGLLTVNGDNQVQPETIPISRNGFTIDGRAWSL